MKYLTSKKVKTKTTKQKGFVLYDGPSVLDGQPIVVIATMETSNRKTGNMVQTWILRSDISPTDASKIGLVCTTWSSNETFFDETFPVAPTIAKYPITFLVFSVFPAPDSPLSEKKNIS